MEFNLVFKGLNLNNMPRWYMTTLLRNVQTRSGVHPTSYAMGTEVPTQG